MKDSVTVAAVKLKWWCYKNTTQFHVKKEHTGWKVLIKQISDQPKITGPSLMDWLFEIPGFIVILKRNKSQLSRMKDALEKASKNFKL